MRIKAFLVATVASLALTSTLMAQDSGYKVIVHSSNPASTIGGSDLSKLFLKRTTTWSDGRTVVPIDLPERSAVRSSFSKSIHRKSVSAIKTYWQQMVFSGRAVPPPEKASAREIVDFVESNPGAVGYVPSNTAIGHCKILAVR